MSLHETPPVAREETPDADTTSRVETTGVTLPASPEDLTFYESEDGVVYAKHEETEELTAITTEGDGTEVADVLGGINEAEMTEIESVDPQEITTDSNTATRRRGD